eukprot:TRINITY_DN89818_c0_g1_i1.p3 TRINITY_DN89818_c0_g1~~TRINITY_DN89818_c0_g1_i1.p3  ORF type:complete len:110 (-),score=12.62 TRINITY_DN89818_c0_g1_i1:70-399(-)
MAVMMVFGKRFTKVAPERKVHPSLVKGQKQKKEEEEKEEATRPLQKKARKGSAHKAVENPDKKTLKKAKLSSEDVAAGWEVSQQLYQCIAVLFLSLMHCKVKYWWFQLL